MINDPEFDNSYGRQARLSFREIEKEAVTHVSNFIEANKIDVDRHSTGETVLAHRAKDMVALRKSAESVFENFGVAPGFLTSSELAEQGFGIEGFHGAMTVPIGFGLNPRKYLAGLMRVAKAQGAYLFEHSPVQDLTHSNEDWVLTTPAGGARATHVVLATNGYSSEDLPKWLGGRFMPAQSTVLVTADQPIRTGIAPAAPPITMLLLDVRFSQRV